MRFMFKNLLTSMVVCTLAATSVRAEDAEVQNPAELAKTKESLAKWKAMKDESGESYEYAVKFQSWTGFSNKTTIVVRDGKVVERRYTEKNGRQPEVARVEIGPDGEERTIVEKPKVKGWSEVADEIGTHKQGAPAKTIDELYAQADEILRTKSRERNHMTVKFHGNGLLQLCLFADKNCADDCSQGVRIEEFRFLK